MKKILFICIGLTVLISIILVKLYSSSVVSFVTEVTGQTDSTAIVPSDSSIKKIEASLSDYYEDEEIQEEFDEYEDEYVDTIIKGIDTMIIKVNPTYVDGVVLGNQKIRANIPVKFKILENIEVKEKFIPANTVFFAMPEIANDEVKLSVNTFQTERGVVIVPLHALKEDLKDVLEGNSSSTGPLLIDGDTVLFDY